MTPTQELHAIIRSIIGDDPPVVVAIRCGVPLASARRWVARDGFIVPSRGALQRLFDAYAVSITTQDRAMALYAGCTHAD